MVLISEITKRKKFKTRHIDVSENFNNNIKDLEDYALDEIGRVIELLKNRKDEILERNYNLHELDKELKGYHALHLFPNQRGKDDIVIILEYKKDGTIKLLAKTNHKEYSI